MKAYTLLIFLVFLFSFNDQGKTDKSDYLNTKISTEKRIGDPISLMTLEEKTSQMNDHASTIAKNTDNLIIVAADGSGDFTSVQGAIKAVPALSEDKTVIFIKSGVYKEKVVVPTDKQNIQFLGENAQNTVITWDDYSGKEDIDTFSSYTIKIMGNNIMMENLTIENSEGLRGQAVALDVEGNQCVFKNCRIVGNQDTLYAAGNNNRQYFKDCYIEGTTDFIFGSSTAVFDNCDIMCKKQSFITAARTAQGKHFGYVFKNCKIKAASGIKQVYLGRPWRAYANVVFINCELGGFISPEGWSNWHDTDRYKFAFYAEYHNTGAGANTNQRVAWSHQLTDEQAAIYTVENILGFNNWKLK